MTTILLAAPGSVELHLNPDPSLPRRFGKRIKKMGGSYRAARGHADTRFVSIPWTAEGRDLANTLVEQFGRDFGSKKTVCIMRGGEIKHTFPAWVVVQNVPTKCADPMAAALGLYQGKFDQAVKRKIIKEDK